MDRINKNNLGITKLDDWKKLARYSKTYFRYITETLDKINIQLKCELKNNDALEKLVSTHPP